MNASLGRRLLYALIVCSTASASVNAAGIRPSGAETGQPADSLQRRESALAAGNAKRDAAGRDLPVKSRDQTTRSAETRYSAARNVTPSAVLHGSGFIPPRNASALLGAHAKLSKPIVAAARGYRLRRPDANHPVSRSDPNTAVVHGISAATALDVAGRQSSAILPATRRSPASLKAQAGNGVIGGPRAPGRGMLGGPANSSTMMRATINGTALHRRF